MLLFFLSFSTGIFVGVFDGTCGDSTYGFYHLFPLPVCMYAYSLVCVYVRVSVSVCVRSFVRACVRGHDSVFVYLLQHNLCCDNCHSHVAMVLNLLLYDGSSQWNMVKLCFYMAIFGRYTR